MRLRAAEASPRRIQTGITGDEVSRRKGCFGGPQHDTCGSNGMAIVFMSWNNTVESKQILSKEIGTIIKDWGGKLPIALAYPNTYYVGMSSLALQILYRRFNEHVDVVCERVFWDKGGWEARRPLRSLETQQRAEEFAVWAFTISYEMDYFNVVEMLRQAGVPPLAADRDERWPLLIAGGPGITMNPEPMAPFFDAIVIGEGEEVVDTLVDTIRDVGDEDRGELLDALDRIEGVYVPAKVEPVVTSLTRSNFAPNQAPVGPPPGALPHGQLALHA